MLLERQQDSPVQSYNCQFYEDPLKKKTLKRSLSLEDTQVYSDSNNPIGNIESKNFRSNQNLTDLKASSNFSNNNSLITISIDKLTLKRNTLYDRAKLRVYLEQCRLQKKKAEFDSLTINEDDLRIALQEMHDQEMANEYANREKLMQKIMGLQNENQELYSTIMHLKNQLNATFYQSGSPLIRVETSPNQLYQGSMQRMSNPSCFSMDLESDSNNTASGPINARQYLDQQQKDFRMSQNSEKIVLNLASADQQQNMFSFDGRISDPNFYQPQLNNNPSANVFYQQRQNPNSSLTFSYSPYNPDEETQKLNLREINQELVEYNFKLNEIDEDNNPESGLRQTFAAHSDNEGYHPVEIIIENPDEDLGENIDESEQKPDEGELHKNFFLTVGSMAYLKQPNREWLLKRLSNNYLSQSIKQMEDTQRISSILKSVSEENAPLPIEMIKKEINNNSQTLKYTQRAKSRNKLMIPSGSNGSSQSSSFIQAKKCIDQHQNMQGGNIASSSTIASHGMNHSLLKTDHDQPDASINLKFYSNNNVIEQIIHMRKCSNDTSSVISSSQIKSGNAYQPFHTQTSSSFVVFDALNVTQSGIHNEKNSIVGLGNGYSTGRSAQKMKQNGQYQNTEESNHETFVNQNYSMMVGGIQKNY